MPTYEELKPEYQRLFDGCAIQPERLPLVQQMVDRILQNVARYEVVQTQTGVPWAVIAVIHALECSLNFSQHLHNGDPLTARTTRVPAGRPLGEPPFTWEASAADAIALQKLDRWQDWSIPGMLYVLERYNGLGYRQFQIPTPYLWSFSNHYVKGKFVRDGKFDPEAVSQQCGAAILLKAMVDRGIDLGAIVLPEQPTQPVAPPPPTTRLPYPGRTIKLGETDANIVKALQLRLNEVGCGPLQGTGNFREKTEAAVKQFQTRFTDLQGKPLAVDGEVGPLTWAALFGPDPAPPQNSGAAELAKLAIDIAVSQIGVQEQPITSNRGPEVNEYLRSVGLPPGNFWCAAFVYWCFNKAAAKLGRSNPLTKTGHVLTHWRDAQQKNIPVVTRQQALANPALVKPGMIFIMDKGGGKGHTGIVEQVRGTKLVTIEGNTNDDSSRDGHGVFRLETRSIASINAGFIDYSRR